MQRRTFMGIAGASALSLGLSGPNSWRLSNGPCILSSAVKPAWGTIVANSGNGIRRCIRIHLSDLLGARASRCRRFGISARCPRPGEAMETRGKPHALSHALPSHARVGCRWLSHQKAECESRGNYGVLEAQRKSRIVPKWSFAASLREYAWLSRQRVSLCLRADIESAVTDEARSGAVLGATFMRCIIKTHYY